MRRFLATLAFAGALGAAPALGQDHQHPTETFDGATARFYETWMRPDQPMVSCCNKMDCAPVSEVKQVNGQWKARRVSDGVWLDIPPEKVEERRDSPDGRSHLCSIGSTILCFIVGSGS